MNFYQIFPPFGQPTLVGKKEKEHNTTSSPSSFSSSSPSSYYYYYYYYYYYTTTTTTTTTTITTTENTYSQQYLPISEAHMSRRSKHVPITPHTAYFQLPLDKGILSSPLLIFPPQHQLLQVIISPQQDGCTSAMVGNAETTRY